MLTPAPGLAYHQLHRAGPRGWWRPLVGVFAVIVFWFGSTAVIVGLAFVLELLVSGQSLTAEVDLLADPGPILLGGILFSIAILVPVALAVSWLLHGVTPGWLTSVVGRVRWAYLAGCAGLAVVTLFLTIGLMTVLPAGTDQELDSEPTDLTGRVVALLLVTLLLVPLQSAGEEYVFRGYLTQAFGASFPTVVAVVGPALIFALAHGGQELPIFVDRLAFGLVAGYLVIRTGGLEAGIAMHIVNNWFAFGIAILFGSLGDAFAPSGASWWMLPTTLLQSLLYLALASWLARSMGIATRTPGAPVSQPG